MYKNLSKILATYIIFQMVVSVSWAQEVSKEGVVVKEELIFPIQDQHVHGSSIVSLPNGDLLVAWFHGSGERTADDVRIMGARLKKGENDWSAPFELADTPNLPDCNPVLFLNEQGKLFLVWIAVQANRWEHSILRFRTSTDFSREGPPIWDWQDNILLKPGDEFAEETALKFKELPRRAAGWAEYAPPYDRMIVEASQDPTKRSTGWMTRIKPLVLEGGKILLPLYSDGYNMSLVAISDDHGETWKPSLPIVGRGPIQPALAKRENGDIVALMRDSGDSPNRVHQSISKDGGVTWSPSVRTTIPNTASVELLVLDNGAWAYLGNDVDDGRYRVTLAFSENEGELWNQRVYLEDKKKGEGNFSYPALIQTPDGLLHLTYSYHLSGDQKSIKYIRVDPRKLVGNK